MKKIVSYIVICMLLVGCGAKGEEIHVDNSSEQESQEVQTSDLKTSDEAEDIEETSELEEKDSVIVPDDSNTIQKLVVELPDYYYKDEESGSTSIWKNKEGNSEIRITGTDLEAEVDIEDMNNYSDDDFSFVAGYVLDALVSVFGYNSTTRVDDPVIFSTAAGDRALRIDYKNGDASSCAVAISRDNSLNYVVLNNPDSDENVLSDYLDAVENAYFEGSIEENNGKDIPELYYDVFVKYAGKINDKSASFDIVLKQLNDTNYVIEYTKPTDTDLGAITVKDGTDYYAYIDFYPNINGVETIMDVNYGAKGVGEVSVSDNAHISSIEYSYLLGSRKKVSSLSDLEDAVKQIIAK